MCFFKIGWQKHNEMLDFYLLCVLCADDCESQVDTDVSLAKKNKAGTLMDHRQDPPTRVWPGELRRCPVSLRGYIHTKRQI